MKSIRLALFSAFFIISTVQGTSHYGDLFAEEFCKAAIWRGVIAGEKLLGREYSDFKDCKVIQSYLNKASNVGAPFGACNRLKSLQTEFITNKDPKIREEIKANCDFILSYPWQQSEPVEQLKPDDIADLRNWFETNLPGMEQLQDVLHTYTLTAFTATSLFGVAGSKPALPLCFVSPEGFDTEWIAALVCQALQRQFVCFAFGSGVTSYDVMGSANFGKKDVPAKAGLIAKFLHEHGRLDVGAVLYQVDKTPKFVIDILKGVLDAGLPPVDNYLGVAPDCSQLVVMATTHNPFAIDPDLSERMEFINVPAMSIETKILRVQKFIVRDAAHEAGFPAHLAKLDDGVIRTIIEKYTNEPGMRELAKLIYKLFRRASQMFQEHGVVIEFDEKHLPNFLGNSILGVISQDETARELVYSLEHGSDLKDLEYLKLTPEAQLEAERDIAEMRESMGSSKSSARSHLEWLLSLPWEKRLGFSGLIDLGEAKGILDRDHFGLSEVKERVLDFLALGTKQSQAKKIICLVGPPGVGKTSIGKSIAEAMGCKFGRVALGGAWGESVIRGWERSYVSAAPGRIIKAIKEAGVCNPFLMLDEIDKLAGGGHSGDPASALLEVLDPVQNSKFVDAYLGCAFNLSEVTFIVTANQLGPIHPALRDRLEIIEIPGYVIEEKYQIAKQHLIPDIIKSLELSDDEFSLSRELICKIIEDYTRESGVRLLRQKIAQLAHKAIRCRLEGKLFEPSVTELEKYLGAPFPSKPSWKQLIKSPGVSIGLAWTAYGGCICLFEVSLSVGNGKTHLTGNLGDTMKESIEVAIGYVKANASHFGIESSRFETTDIHVHYPEWGVEGPSAGGALTTAIISALTNKTIKPGYAMTGDIDLKGNIWPIGGLKEKLIAAKSSGMTNVFIPEGNRADLEQIDKDMLGDLMVTPVSHIKTILDQIFE